MCRRYTTLSTGTMKADIPQLTILLYINICHTDRYIRIERGRKTVLEGTGAESADDGWLRAGRIGQARIAHPAL
jgi:hypothetical protein